MHKVCKLIILDFMITKYFLNQIIFSYVILAVTVGSTYTSLINIVYFLPGVMLISYPFMMEEKNNLNKLYITLPIKKKDLIFARYLLCAIYVVFISCILIIINLILRYIFDFQISIEDSFSLISLGTSGFLLLNSIQLPLYFKYGYSKARIVSIALPTIIFSGVPAITILIGKVVGEEATLEFVKKVFQTIFDYADAFSIGFLLLGCVGLFISFIITRHMAGDYYE